jgi:phosphoribosyl-AMP cyclohydrolase
MTKKIKFNLKNLKFDKQGLIPAIIQDYRNNQVLMLAFMNRESLARTLKSGKTCFWSRSRKEYWVKGKTSGNYQFVKSIAYDCDMDALLIKVRQAGVACHTGNRSCFYRKII